MLQDIQLELAILLLAGAFVLGIWALASHFNEKSVVRTSLRQLEGYEVENVRDQELLAPISERALLPAVGALTSLGRRFTPVGYVDSIRQKKIYAGDGSADAVDRFLAVRVITVALTPLAFFVIYLWNPVGLEGTTQHLGFALLVFSLLAGPDAILARQVDERMHELRVTLPDVLDLLTISVEAGLGFEQALDRVINAVPGALSDEFARMLGEVRAGASRADAMRALE